MPDTCRAEVSSSDVHDFKRKWVFVGVIQLHDRSFILKTETKVDVSLHPLQQLLSTEATPSTNCTKRKTCGPAELVKYPGGTCRGKKSKPHGVLPITTDRYPEKAKRDSNHNFHNFELSK